MPVQPIGGMGGEQGGAMARPGAQPQGGVNLGAFTAQGPQFPQGGGGGQYGSMGEGIGAGIAGAGAAIGDAMRIRGDREERRQMAEADRAFQMDRDRIQRDELNKQNIFTEQYRKMTEQRTFVEKTLYEIPKAYAEAGMELPPEAQDHLNRMALSLNDPETQFLRSWAVDSGMDQETIDRMIPPPGTPKVGPDGREVVSPQTMDVASSVVSNHMLWSQLFGKLKHQKDGSKIVGDMMVRAGQINEAKIEATTALVEGMTEEPIFNETISDLIQNRKVIEPEVAIAEALDASDPAIATLLQEVIPSISSGEINNVQGYDAKIGAVTIALQKRAAKFDAYVAERRSAGDSNLPALNKVNRYLHEWTARLSAHQSSAALGAALAQQDYHNHMLEWMGNTYEATGQRPSVEQVETETASYWMQHPVMVEAQQLIDGIKAAPPALYGAGGQMNPETQQALQRRVMDRFPGVQAYQQRRAAREMGPPNLGPMGQSNLGPMGGPGAQQYNPFLDITNPQPGDMYRGNR